MIFKLISLLCLLVAGTDSQVPDDSSNLFQCFRCRGLHFLHLNVRSLLPKISEIKIVAQQSNPAVICISESWLDSSITDEEIRIDNYNIIRNDRNRQGGGVCMYIRNNLAFNPRDDLQRPDLESIWCDLLLPRSKPILIGTVYRTQKSLKFVEYFDNVIS